MTLPVLVCIIPEQSLSQTYHFGELSETVHRILACMAISVLGLILPQNSP